MDTLFIVGIVLLAITLIGHGIWVALAWLLRGGRSPKPRHRGAEPTVADDRTATLRYLERLASRNFLDKETYARLIRLMSEDAQDLPSLAAYLAMTRPAPFAKPVRTGLADADPPEITPVDEQLAPGKQQEPWTELPEPQPGEFPSEEPLPEDWQSDEEPVASTPLAAPQAPPQRRLIFDQLQEPVSPPRPRRPLGEVLAGFMAERNIRWGELVGGLLIVGCSTALVISLWAQIEAIPLLKFLLFTAVTAALFGSGLFVQHRWKLPATGHALLLISTLLVPLNVLAFAAFSQPGAVGGVALFAEAASLVLFGWLIWLAGRVIMPLAPLSFAASVIGLSATSLVVRFLAPTKGLPLTTVSLLPISISAAAVAVSIWRRRTAQPIAESGARALLLHLGVLSFATLVPLGLLIYQADKSAAWLGSLSIPFCLMACAPLFLGAFLWERLPPRSGALRTAAISITLLAECIMLGGVIAAWPMPARLLPAMLLNGAAMIGLAALMRRPLMHALAIAWMAGTWLLGAHLALGRLAWSEVSGEAILWVILSAISGKALIAAVVACAVTAEWLRRRGQKVVAGVYAGGAAAMAVLSIALVTMFGFAVLGDPHHVTWVYLAYAAVGFVAAARSKKAIASWAGCMMLQMALVQTLVYAWPLGSLARPTSLLVGASFCVVASVTLRLTRRASEFDDAIVQPLASFAVLCSLGGVATMCFTASADLLGSFSTRMFWVSALWATLAVAHRSQALFAGAQLALLGAFSTAAHSYLRGLTWYQALDSPVREPWVWQVHCAAAALMGLMWALVRLGVREPAHAAMPDSPVSGEPVKPAWREIASDLLYPTLPSVDRWMSASAGLGVISLALWGLAPAMAAEHGWKQTMLPVIHHLHASGPGSWVALLLVCAALVLYRRDGLREATQGLVVLAAAGFALMACRWEPHQAATAAWRWMTAAAFAIGSIALWTRDRWAPRLRPIIGRGNGSSSAEVLRTYLFILFALPAVLFSATFAMAFGGGSRGVLTVASDTSLRISLLGPPVLVAITLFAHGIRRRQSGYAVAAAFTTCATLTTVELAILSRGGLAPGPATLIWLVQLNAMSLSIFALVWHGIQKADPSRPIPDYPRWPMQVVRVALGAVLVLAAAALWVTPRMVPSIVTQAGTLWGILAVGLVEWSSLSTRSESRGDSGRYVSLWPILGAIVIACGLAPWDTGNWLCFHVLMIGVLAAAGLQLLDGNRRLHRLLGAGWQESFGAALTRSSGRAASIDHDLSCGNCSYNLRGLDSSGKCPECSAPIAQSLSMALERLTPGWSARLGDCRKRTTIGVLGCIAMATLFALRAALDDPQRPWWSAGTLALSAALAMSVAAWVPRRAIAYLAGLEAMMAVSVWWLVQHWSWRGSAAESDFGDLLNVNVVALCLAGLAWFWLERALVLRKLGDVRSPDVLPFHHAAAALCAITVSSLAGFSLYASAVEHPIAAVASLTWLAWAACLAAMGACLGRPQLRHAPAGLYILGLAALLIVMAGIGASQRTLAWVMPLVLSSYVLLTTVAWRLWRRLDPRSLLSASLRTWLPHANGILVLMSVVLVFYTSITPPLFAVRLLTVLPPFICAASAVLLAQGKQERFLQTPAVGLAAAGGILLAWSSVPPDAAQPWLHRAVMLLAATAAVVSALGVARSRSAPGLSTAIRGTAVGTVAAGGAALLYLIALEGAALIQGSGVPLTWSAVIVAIAGLVHLLACFIAFALRPAWDPLGVPGKWRGAYVYSAEVLAALVAVHVRSTMPWLFSGLITQYWPILLMALAFAAIAAGEIFERRGVAVLARPLNRSGIFLPALAVVDFFLAASRVHYSVVLLTAGMFYAVLAGLRRSTLLGLVAAFCVNGSLWYLLHHTPGLGLARHPQLWFIPPAMAVLAAAHLSRRTLSEEARTTIHYGCLLVIYLSSTADVFLVGVANAPWLPLVLGGLSVAGIFAGIGWRLRSFLQMGIGFLCLSLLTIIWHAAANLGWTWVWYVAGIALGVTIIAVFALFEKKKNEMTALLQNLRHWSE